MNGYADYSQIEEISTASAVVIAAEYDRAAKLIGKAPPTINLDEWKQPVFGRLFELGFFEIVGLTEDVGKLFETAGKVRTMRILSGKNSGDLEKASERLRELSRFIDEDGPLTQEVFVALNTALSEAMGNVARHAYPTDHSFPYRHVGQWWVAASADQENRTLTVVIYDQGATIPVTLPRKSWTRTLADFIARNLSATPTFEFQDDAVYIEGAMQPGATQTDRAWHGKGLPQMRELVDICGGGSLTILSRGGFCRYVPGKGFTRTAKEHSIGGTLIEWVMELPQVN